MTDNRNMILAIVLSIVVLFGWQFLVAGPQAERARRDAEIAAQQQAAQQAQQQAATPQTITTTAPDGSVTTTTVPAATPGTATYADRAAAIAASPRVKIDTESLTGSINLVGARLDDLSLKKYHETVDKTSPIINLLTPNGAPDAYFAEQGFASASGSAAVPDDATWTLEGDNQTLTAATPVSLRYDNGKGLVFHRTFTVDENYLFTITQSVDNATGADVQLFPYSRVARHGTPLVHNFFILQEGPYGVLGDKNLMELSYPDLKKDHQRDQTSTGGWLGFTDKYWATVVLPTPGTAINGRFFSSSTNGRDDYQASFVESAPLVVPAGQTATNKSYVFAGAKVESIINSYKQTYGFDSIDLLIDWGWFHFITYPMFLLIRFLYGILGNFGLAILAVTVIVKALFFPLANRSYASMAAMRKVQPEMKALQERFKDDRAAQQQAMMELYKREKINPIAGCWPILIQIPVFFSLYKTLFVTIEMRHAPFFGWIQDLASPDPTNIFTLFGLIPWDPTTLPLVGGFLHLGVWPLVMGFTMWLQMRLQPPPPDATQAAIFNWMPVIFTFMLGSFPAGLVIYWAWNNALSVTQQYVIMRRNGAEVDLLGNIAQSFRRKPRPKAAE